MVSLVSTSLAGNEWFPRSPRPTTCLLASVCAVWLGLVGGKGSAPGCARCVTGRGRAMGSLPVWANTWRPKLPSDPQETQPMDTDPSIGSPTEASSCSMMATDESDLALSLRQLIGGVDLDDNLPQVQSLLRDAGLNCLLARPPAHTTRSRAH